MESLARVVVALLGGMLLASVLALALGGARNRAVRAFAVVCGLIGGGLGASLAVRVESTGALVIGGLAIVASVAGIARAWRTTARERAARA